MSRKSKITANISSFRFVFKQRLLFILNDFISVALYWIGIQRRSCRESDDNSATELIVFRVTCIFLATKTENHYISVEKFASKLPKVESSWIIEQEFVVMDALRFNLMIHHPYLALHGLFLDMQDLIENHDILFDIYEKSIQLCHESYLSDVCLIYQPSQIALAIFTRAAKSLGLDLIEKYIHVRFRDHEKLADLLSILEEIGSVLEGSSKPDKNVVAEIDRRLFFLRNPLSDPNINL